MPDQDRLLAAPRRVGDDRLQDQEAAQEERKETAGRVEVRRQAEEEAAEREPGE